MTALVGETSYPFDILPAPHDAGAARSTWLQYGILKMAGGVEAPVAAERAGACQGSTLL